MHPFDDRGGAARGDHGAFGDDRADAGRGGRDRRRHARRGADPDTVVTGRVEFDSRQVGPGGLFVAMRRRARRRARLRLGGASAAGAVAAHRHPAGRRAQHRGRATPLAALAALASAVLRRLPDATVVGITGSSGKTSTKDLLAQLLAEPRPDRRAARLVQQRARPPVHGAARRRRRPASSCSRTSARGIGHIRYLTDIAPPRIGVVLNVGTAHLGEFGTAGRDRPGEGRARRGAAGCRRGGVAVLNADDPLVRAMAARTPARVVRFGESRRCRRPGGRDPTGRAGPARVRSAHRRGGAPRSRCGSSASTRSATPWRPRPSPSSAG